MCSNYYSCIPGTTKSIPNIKMLYYRNNYNQSDKLINLNYPISNEEIRRNYEILKDSETTAKADKRQDQTTIPRFP